MNGLTRMTNDLFEDDQNYCVDYNDVGTYKKRVRAAAKFCAERHRIYVKKASGQFKPWTTDPILSSYRFCNIYRELDKVTVQIMEDVIKPNLNNPNIACLALAARLINHPRTLNLMLDEGFDFSRKPNHERLFKLFQSIQKEKGQKLVTGSYICNTIFPKGYPKVDGSKGDYLANFFAPLVWERRAVLAEGLASGSFAGMIDAYKTVHGIGAFIANQAAVDLTYTKLLSSAEDIDSTWNPGPGTIKGIRWITGDLTLSPGKKATNEALTRYRDDLNEMLAGHKMFSNSTKDMKTHLIPLTGPNASNSLCELAKHVWMATGKRDRLKNTYKGN